KYQNQSVGHQHLQQVLTFVQKTEKAPLQQVTEGQSQNDTQRQRYGKVINIHAQRIYQIGADHEETAVRQIDDAHDAKDQRQPAGDQKQQQPVLHTVQTLNQKCCYIHI